MPVAVFYSKDLREDSIIPISADAYRLCLEPLNEDAVEKRDQRLDGFERRLGSLRVLLSEKSVD